jgi:hypothetical protein
MLPAVSPIRLCSAHTGAVDPQALRPAHGQRSAVMLTGAKAVVPILGLLACAGTSACSGTHGPQVSAPSADSLLAAAVRVYDVSRGPTGLYRDRVRFDGAHDGPASIATTGMGLISLCIGSRMGINPSAATQAKTTVRTLVAMAHARNGSGFYYHFVDLEAGSRAGESEYSSIDTAILVSGALVAASCLAGDRELDSLVATLWESVEWSRAIADPTTGAIYLEMLADGSGSPGALTTPFSEYMLVAWLATLAERTGTGPATELWERFYASADSLPTSAFAGHVVLTDRPGAFLSSFVIQFVYYLCHPFTTSEEYRAYLRSAQRADRSWWRQLAAAGEHEWGLGAGSAGSVPYHADAIGDNPDRIVSPHVVAGFLPVDSAALSDLQRHVTSTSRALRSLAGVDGVVLWRYSVTDPSWTPQELQGIDYASMMLGLAGHVLGPTFLAEHNDFEAWLAGIR